jgi:plastocyanin
MGTSRQAFSFIGDHREVTVQRRTMSSIEFLLRVTVLAVFVGVVAVACSSGGDTTTTAAVGTSTTVAAATTTAGGETTTSAAGGETIVIHDFSFNPSEITVPVGTTVTWNNGDGVGHTSTSDDGLWDSDVIQPGDTFEFTFAEPGVYPFHCNIHRTMTGAVTVEG